jgi:hypothetical protein
MAYFLMCGLAMTCAGRKIRNREVRESLALVLGGSQEALSRYGRDRRALHASPDHETQAEELGGHHENVRSKHG